MTMPDMIGFTIIDQGENIMFTGIKKAFMCIIVFSLFIGCATKPLTRNLINDISLEDINRFQYYTSAKIVLTATERMREQNIDPSGAARIRESSYRDKIIIGKNTMGVLMDYRIDADGILILEICFEEKASDSDKRITFRQGGTGLERNFYVEYADPRRRILNYGGREYTLDTNSGERVFLQIRIRKSEIETERVRRVKGRRVVSQGDMVPERGMKET